MGIFVGAAFVLGAPAALSGQDALGNEVHLTQASSQPAVASLGGLATIQGDGFVFRSAEWLYQSLFPGQSGAEALGIARAMGSAGSGNVAVIEQDGERNVATIEQFGQANVAAVFQRGSDNRIHARQDGNNNTFGAWLDGSNNEFDLTQRGSDNRYYLGFAGRGLDHSVMQEGSGLRAIQVGVGAAPFGIQQRGNDMGIRIEHNGGR